jgi:hypothetical protein
MTKKKKVASEADKKQRSLKPFRNPETGTYNYTDTRLNPEKNKSLFGPNSFAKC